MPVWLAAFLIALPFGSLVEYWGHRAMHTFFLKKKHVAHHKEGGAQGWFWEFVDYVVGTGIFLPLGFIYSVEAGLGFLGGGLVFAAFAAYSHQLQHERPDICFWLPRPVHFLHHQAHMWRHNFGISLDIWDRVFGTYKVVDWNPPGTPENLSFRDFFRIKWL